MWTFCYIESRQRREISRSFSRRCAAISGGGFILKLEALKSKKRARGGGWKQRRECCGCSTAVVNRCYCSSSYYYYTSSWRDDFTFFYALHCNRNREGNLRRGIRKYEREREREADVARASWRDKRKPLFCFNGAVSLLTPRSNFSNWRRATTQQSFSYFIHEKLSRN